MDLRPERVFDHPVNHALPRRDGRLGRPRRDLGYARLTKAALWFVDLTGANLSGTTLTNAYIDYATLTNANLSGARLDSAYLSGSNLQGAHFGQCHDCVGESQWHQTRLRSILRHRQLQGRQSGWHPSLGRQHDRLNSQGKNLSYAVFSEGHMGMANADLTGANLSYAKLAPLP